MYKALNYWVFGGFEGAKTPYEFIDFAAEQGLDGIELIFGDIILPEISDAECVKIREYAKAKNVGLRTMASGAGWGQPISAEDEAEAAAAFEFNKRYLEVAALLGAETVLIVPGATKGLAPDAPVRTYKSVWDRSVAALKKLAPIAEKLNVNIGVENVWNRFLLSPMEWKYFLAEIDSPNVGIYLDVANTQYQLPAEDYVEILGSSVKAVHIKNYKKSGDWGSVLDFGENILDGDVNFKNIIAALNKVGYKGAFTAEMIPFSRGENLNIPDYDLSVKTVKAMKEIFG